MVVWHTLCVVFLVRIAEFLEHGFCLLIIGGFRCDLVKFLIQLLAIIVQSGGKI